MLFNTGKSGKLWLDTTQNYIECMSSHTKDDPIVTAEDVREGEKVLNNHVKNWVRIGRMGEDQNHTWRVNRALISNHTTIPPLMGLRKDHKGDIDNNPEKGPKLRPLCPANVSPNAALGDLMAKIAKGLADEFQSQAQTEVISTEELKFHIEGANRRIQDRIASNAS